MRKLFLIALFLLLTTVPPLVSRAATPAATTQYQTDKDLLTVGKNTEALTAFIVKMTDTGKAVQKGVSGRSTLNSMAVLLMLRLQEKDCNDF